MSIGAETVRRSGAERGNGARRGGELVIVRGSLWTTTTDGAEKLLRRLTPLRAQILISDFAPFAYSS